MLVMIKCVAEAVVAKGVKGLAEIVPGGQYLFDVANEALKRLRERKRATELRAEVLAAAQATNEEAKQVAAQVAREVAEAAPPEDRLALEMYLTQIPGAVRQSLRRADDPSGRSVPDGFALNDPADLLKRLPSRAAKFRPGDPLPGKPGWQLVELLGTGGFGEVWLARNPSLSALKGAVKFGLDPQARDRLLRHEGSLVNRVMEEGKHPNVVQLLDAHLDGDAPWLMYEYVPGGDLTGLIFAWQSLPPDERAKRVTAALQTLAAAVGHFHRLSPPLVHRDLKPANILVGKDEGGRMKDESNAGSDSAVPSSLILPPSSFLLKVSDFGIGGAAAAASLAENATRRSSTGYLASQLLGSHTPLYASPQQQRGDAPDPRDDVHALGVIGFQMLTGRLDATLGADYAKTLRRLNVPEPLIELLGDCAAHDLDNRPTDAADLADKLAACGVAKSSPPPDPESQLVPCPQCHATLKIAKGEMRPIRCTNCSHTFRPFAPPPAPPPVRARPVAAPAAELVPPPTLPTNLRGARPAGKRRNDDDDEPRRRGGRGVGRSLAVVFGVILLGCVGLPVAAVYIFLFSSGGPKTSFKHVGPTNEPPERSIEELMKRVEVEGRTTDMLFSPDATRLATVSDAGDVVVWNVRGPVELGGGQFQNWGGKSRVAGHRPAFSPDSTRFAVGAPGESSPDQIELFEAAVVGGMQPRPDFRTGLADSAAKLAFSPDGRWLVAGGAEKGCVKAWAADNPKAKPLSLIAETGAVTHTQNNDPCPINTVVFGHGGKRLLTAGGDHVRVWKTELWPSSLVPEVSFDLGAKITAAGIDPDPRSRWCGAGGANGVVRVWDFDPLDVFGRPIPPNAAKSPPNAPKSPPVAPKMYEQTKANLGAVKQLAFSTFRHVAAIDGAGVGALWEARNPARLTPIDWHAKGARVTAIAFNPEGSLFATAGDDKTVRFWDQFFNKPIDAKIECAAAVTAIAFTADGSRMAVATADGTVTVWLVPNPKKKMGD